MHYLLLPQLNYIITVMIYTGISELGEYCPTKLKTAMMIPNLIQFQFMDINWYKMFCIHDRNPAF
jgi:hypothetical protein